jgi:CRISPR-associated protein Cmr4
MTTEIKPFFIKTITPLHVGSGSDLGVVDMPIQRESHTGFPKIEASSLKGAIRSEFESINGENEAEKIFGTGDKAGDLGFSDARILFFPVKSVKGVFAYVTCPMVLERLKEDLKFGGVENLEEIKIPSSIDYNECIVFENNKNSVNEHVILEEYSFIIKQNKLDNSFKIPQIDKTRLVVISDDNFTHFVKNSTEVITRIKIGEDGVVDKKAGALFTEEYLPSETVMYALALGEVNKFIENTPDTLQIGGNSTLGKGIVEISCEGCGNE